MVESEMVSPVSGSGYLYNMSHDPPTHPSGHTPKGPDNNQSNNTRLWEQLPKSCETCQVVDGQPKDVSILGS
jgi:hypothetical protein